MWSFFFFGIAFIWYCSLSKQRLSVLTVLIISLKWTHESHMRCCQHFTLLILLVVALQQNYWHHVHTSHMVVFDPWAHFPFWYRNDYTFSHTYTLRHAYLQEMFSNERNNLIYIWTCCLSASSWQQWLPSLQCPPSWDCKHSNVCISSDCYHWSSVWCSSHVAFKMTGSVGDCWTDP